MRRHSSARKQPLPAVDGDLEKRLANYRVCFVLCTARETDMPIVYASESFLEMTGYKPEEVIGRNCRFLHGPETSRQKVMEIRSAIQEDRAVQVCLRNYKKNGEPFWNQLFLAPIFDGGVVQYYLGIQADVTAEVEAGRLAHMHLQGAAEEEEEELLTEEPGSLEAARQEARTAAGLSNAIRAWHASHRECMPVARPAVGPAAAPCLPTSLLVPLMKLAQSFVLADPAAPDCPIVYASARFLALTGHPREAVLGRNCRFLQGPGTDPEALRTLREGIATGRPTTVKLLNYRHDGRPFWNNLHVAPVRAACGKVVFLVGVQLDISVPAAASPSAAASASQSHTSLPAADPVSAQPALGSSPGGPPDLAAPAPAPAAADAVLTDYGVRATSSAPAALGPEQAPPHNAGLPNGHHKHLSVGAAGGGGGGGAAAGEDEIIPGEPSGRDIVAQRGVCGAVRVACRTLCPDAGLRRSISDQQTVRRSSDLVRRSSEVARRPPPLTDARVSA